MGVHARATRPSVEELSDRLATGIHNALTSSSKALSDVFMGTNNPMVLSVASAATLGVVFDELRKLQARVKALETTPVKTIEYKGTWDQSTTYAVGNACTFAGSLWVAKTASVSRRPGAGDGSWQLAVKHGQPGRDGKDGTCRCAAGEQDPT